MKKGLGKGLEALLSDPDRQPFESEERVEEIPLSEIDPNPEQPRKRFNDERLEQLAESIRTVGIIQPIIVKRELERYTIIAGERRWRAARQAGLKSIPCIVRYADQVQQLELAIIENLQRDDLNPIEEANAIRSLMEECGLTQDAVASRIGRSRPAVANLLRLLTLPQEIQEIVAEGKLSEGHARVLAGLEEPVQQQLAYRAIELGWSVRQMEEARKLLYDPEKPEKVKRVKEPAMEMQTIVERMREVLGTKVSITGTQKKGRITIQYFSMDELERIYEWIGREQ